MFTTDTSEQLAFARAEAHRRQEHAFEERLARSLRGPHSRPVAPVVVAGLTCLGVLFGLSGTSTQADALAEVVGSPVDAAGAGQPLDLVGRVR